jgi:D-3-phosphoglycerate dehydrogenase
MSLVLSTHRLHPGAVELIERVATLCVARSVSPADLIEAARQAEVIIVRAPIPAELFAEAPRLRAAIRHGAGVDMIPIEAATAAGVLVANVPGANARSVAEHIIFCALALARRFPAIDVDLRARGWNPARELAYAGMELSGKTLGLVGFGHIGREVYRLARAFNLAVLVHNPRGRTLPADVVLEPLENVLAKSDFLVLCCPLTQATSGLIDYERLNLMKRSAFLINTARGPIVVEADLLRALDSGVIAGAAIDVFTEQPLAAHHPFFARRNVLLTPHIAGITQESMQRMGLDAARETLRVLSGQLPENLVNPAAVAAYRKRIQT